ncbi:TIGR00366 family protein [Aestuariivita sp.]|jgi:short-chain fatty acids transporter|uniref:short-chain fatty acid transporter n=1 Tax=Aestuariivita sp. TaxID=1872407 RepID=UPI0021710953|nr:TIGR00366 family protein [Aestuariivita sp.]MCE8006978.1 short-chain fatty acid transporter [Aestuariivita sp.]
MTDSIHTPQFSAEPTLFGRLTGAIDRAIQAYLPDPLAIVLLLTLFVFVLGIATGGGTPVEMVVYFGEGFWGLLEFAMQMALVLVTGHVLASTPVFSRALTALARLARSPGTAIILATLVAMAASWINWGFGLVIGAFFARRLAQEVPDVDYRVLIASAYSGFLIWHAGLSGSVPLTAATPGNFLEDTVGLVPTSETLFAPFNLILIRVLVLILPLINRLMLNHGGPTTFAHQIDFPEDAGTGGTRPDTPAARLEHAPWLGWFVGAFGIAFVVWQIAAGTFALTLNSINFIFLFAALALHGSVHSFSQAVGHAVSGVGGILIQFPFYAGVMGMMVGAGLAAGLTDLFVERADASTLPLFAFLSAGFVNVLVPSGGGQWAVQGPIMLPAAETLGADIPRVVMAVAWGDAWTNMIQPFWALPALAIAGLKARDIMGFCLVTLLMSGAVLMIGLTFLP